MRASVLLRRAFLLPESCPLLKQASEGMAPRYDSACKPWPSGRGFPLLGARFASGTERLPVEPDAHSAFEESARQGPRPLGSIEAPTTEPPEQCHRFGLDNKGFQFADAGGVIPSAAVAPTLLPTALCPSASGFATL